MWMSWYSGGRGHPPGWGKAPPLLVFQRSVSSDPRSARLIADGGWLIVAHGVGLRGDETPKQVPHFPGEDEVRLAKQLLRARSIEVSEEDFGLGNLRFGWEVTILAAGVNAAQDTRPLGAQVQQFDLVNKPFAGQDFAAEGGARDLGEDNL